MVTNSKEYMNKYYYEHRDKILAGILKKVRCEICDFELQKTNLTRHMKSKKCLNIKNLKDLENKKMVDT